MNVLVRAAAALVLLVLAPQAFAQITFYEHDGFRGRQFTANGAIGNFRQVGFNDTASSISIDRGVWEVCDDRDFGGRCEVLPPGDYPSLRDLGLNDRISSVAQARGGGRPSYGSRPQYEDDYAYRPRPDERLFQADVTSVRAVYENRGSRCWSEGQYEQRRRDTNVGGAILGGIIGGIIGHQIGDGSGQTAATIGGAVAGAAIGGKAGRDDRGYERGMGRCDGGGRDQPTYYDVSYVFRGQEHWVRMNRPPGRSITVNGRGEPRE